MARKRRNKTLHQDVSQRYPDQDATKYISDVVKDCLQPRHVPPPGEDYKEEDEERDGGPPWVALQDTVRDYPEHFVDLGLLTQEQLEAQPWLNDPALLEEAAFRLYEHYIDTESRMRAADERLHASFEDDEEFEQDFNESPAIIREALREIGDALSSGNAEDVIRVIDILFDETGEHPDDETLVEHWAEQLTEHPRVQTHPAPFHDETHRAVAAAVKDLAVRLCEMIAKDGTALQYIEWRQLEEVVATALEGIGFSVELTKASKDGGKDVIASCILRGKRCIFYVEIKHWRSGKRVGAEPILDFIEINVSAGTTGGLFISTSGYRDTIWTQLSEVERTTVRLGDGHKVISLCQHFTRKGRGLWGSESTLPTLLFGNTRGVERRLATA